MGQLPHFGASQKLINLLMKDVTRLGSLADSVRQQLICLLHVPFDKYSLNAIRGCTRVRIPSSASMGFVESQSIYDELQRVCREVAREAELSPIHIDIAAWNDAH